MSIRANPNRTLCITAIATLALALLYGLCFAQAGKGARAATPAGPGMQKVVTQQASFVLYVPNGWKAQESTDGQALQVIASDPSGRSFVFFSTGAASQGENVTALAKREAAKLGRAARTWRSGAPSRPVTDRRSPSTGPTRLRSGGRPSSARGCPCRGANPPVPASRRRQGSSRR